VAFNRGVRVSESFSWSGGRLKKKRRMTEGIFCEKGPEEEGLQRGEMTHSCGPPDGGREGENNQRKKKELQGTNL